ncbi:hypothetical protein Hanom_Chr13g01228111 [Helianthus anomalus]
MMWQLTCFYVYTMLRRSSMTDQVYEDPSRRQRLSRTFDQVSFLLVSLHENHETSNPLE